jgi:hypothetical protein
MLRGLLVLRHSRPPRAYRGLPQRGFHRQRGGEARLPPRIQRDHPGCGGPHGQHVRHRMREEAQGRHMHRQALPRGFRMSEPAHRPRPSD